MRDTVYKRRGAKSWSVLVEDGKDENGNRIRHYRGGFPTKKAAHEALDDMKSQLRQGNYVPPQKQTLSQFLNAEWLPMIRNSVRPSTYDSYEMHVRKHISPALGSIRLQQVTVGRLNSFYADLLEKGRADGKGGLAPKSVRNCHTILRKALEDGVKWGHLSRNPAAFAEVPKLTGSRDREMKTWNPDEVRRFLHSMMEHRLYAAFHTAVSTGMRRGEVLGLRWSDVDLDESRLSVRQTVITVNYEIQFSTPKTQKSRRSIALDKATVAALREHRKAQLEEKLAIGLSRYQENDLVFCKLDGSPLHPDYFSQCFDRIVTSSDLPRVRLHDLRHTHATLALAAGVHPKVVSERLGHSTVALTLDVYSHAVPAMEASAAEIVAGLIQGTAK